MNTGIAIVFLIIIGAFVLFFLELVPIDVTAIGIMVVLMLLEPWTGITPEKGVSGFANKATLTILAMMILSEGVRRTGVIRKLGAWVEQYTEDNLNRQLGATIGTVGPLSAIINNTAAVAVLLPMISDLAHENDTSPSKLLLPLSYASMFGGMFTLIGTSTNLISSSISEDLIGRSFTMFEFTHLGLVVFVVGTLYLFTIGYWLTPARVQPRSRVKSTESDEFLTEIIVGSDSSLIGMSIQKALERVDFEGNVTQLIRGGEFRREPPMSLEIQQDDVLTVRLTEDALRRLLNEEGVRLLPEVNGTSEMPTLGAEQRLVEIVVTSGSNLVGETIRETNFENRYRATVLAIRRGGETAYERFADYEIQPGDLLLIESQEASVDRMSNDPNVIVAGELDLHRFRSSKMPFSIAIMLSVVALAALGILPILVSAFAGVLAMFITGVIRPSEAYGAVQWDIIFLLAGVIPLGKALNETGGAEWLGQQVVSGADVFPSILVLGLFYLITAVFTNLISNQASVVLLLPVAVESARQIGANEFSFVMAVTFAASTAFMTPVGYQTNLFVYGPGGYDFSDYVRVGGPLQLIMAVVTTIGIAVFWGV